MLCRLTSPNIMEAAFGRPPMVVVSVIGAGEARVAIEDLPSPLVQASALHP